MFLLEFIVVVIVFIFLLFYFNRVIAAVLSYFIRSALWRRYHVFVDLGRCFGEFAI